MKWAELKKAIEQAGIKEDEEIMEIRCELYDGDRTLSPMRQGRFLRLVENLSKEAQKKGAAGCTA